MRVISDENEPLLEVVLTQKRVAYLNPSQLDLYPFAEKLNENQQIVLEWLKEYMLDDSDFYNTVYASKQLYSYGVPYGEESEAFTKLNNRELAQVLELFSKWAQEQEEKQ
ncbi:hypothetical protein [Enterococcus gallinarum]|uniref:hypothetical protein n=1 Tax=Enterococcus gallinarum TaxID=1353 RepID=UPI0020CEAB40|nr:hypothetical protein [Enterococcus gallinarum]